MIVSEINTIDQLKSNLNMGPGYGGYLDILKAIKLNPAEWEKISSWSEEKYTRNCITNCDQFELLQMCWQSGQHSPIHTFHFQEAWIKVLEGELSIDLFKIDRESLSCTLDETFVIKKNEYTYLNDNMGFHRVRASGEGKSVSLHLHAERVKEWEVFRDCKKKFEIVKPAYDTKSTDCTD